MCTAVALGRCPFSGQLLGSLVVALIKLKLGEIQFNAEIRGVPVGVSRCLSYSSAFASVCMCVCMLLCVSHAGVATCIADDAIWCPNAAPTAKYAPVVVFTPSLKRDWDTGTGMGIGVLFLRALPW